MCYVCKDTKKCNKKIGIPAISITYNIPYSTSSRGVGVGVGVVGSSIGWDIWWL